MKWFAFALVVIFTTLQYRIWFGKSSFDLINQQQEKITTIQAENKELSIRNQKLLAEIKDLRKGTDAIEERARYHLEMIKEDETFFRILNNNR